MTAGQRIRSARLRQGMTLGQLAALAGISRQALSLIEADRTQPRIDTAVQIATALGLSVERLFLSEHDLLPSVPQLTAVVEGQKKVWALQGRDALVSRLPVPDVLVSPAGSVWWQPRQGRYDLVIAGCDPFAEWLKEAVQARRPDVHVVLRHLGSEAALRAVRQGEAHVAGIHAGAGAANERLCARVLEREPFVLMGWLGWRTGLLGTGSLRAADARFIVAREPGSEARRVLEDHLREAGIDAERALQEQPQVRGHVEVAQIAQALPGALGVACEPVARVCDLGFRPLREERYELCIPRRFLENPAIKALVETAQQVDWSALQALSVDTSDVGRVRLG